MIKPIFKYSMEKMSDELSIAYDNHLFMESDSSFDFTRAKSNSLFEYCRAEVDRYEIVATNALIAFITFNLCKSNLNYLHLYVHALKYICEVEEVEFINFHIFSQYFKNEFPTLDSLKAAWENQKNGSINRLHIGEF